MKDEHYIYTRKFMDYLSKYSTKKLINEEEAKDGTPIDKKREVDFFVEAMKRNGIYTKMQFNDIKIYSSYVEFSGSVPITNNKVEWTVDKDCSIRFENPIRFSDDDEGVSFTDIIQLKDLVDEIYNVVSAINEYYEGLKKRIPEYVGDIE